MTQNEIKMVVETERLILRELKEEDFEYLFAILSDEESMIHYPRTYTEEEVMGWIRKNITGYSEEGFGLWAIVLKENNTVIGDCGITMQNINGKSLPEIGYHINKKCIKQGYATEAAKASRKLGFEKFDLDEIYSYMTEGNIGSCRVAEKNGMILRYKYEDEENGEIRVYSITKEEYNEMK